VVDGRIEGTVAPCVKLAWLQIVTGLETQKSAPVIVQPLRTPHSADSPGAVPEGPWLPIFEVLLMAAADSVVVLPWRMKTNEPGPKMPVSCSGPTSVVSSLVTRVFVQRDGTQPVVGDPVEALEDIGGRVGRDRVDGVPDGIAGFAVVAVRVVELDGRGAGSGQTDEEREAQQ
jgi:hypothetical protein